MKEEKQNELEETQNELKEGNPCKYCRKYKYCSKRCSKSKSYIEYMVTGYVVKRIFGGN